MQGHTILNWHLVLSVTVMYRTLLLIAGEGKALGHIVLSNIKWSDYVFLGVLMFFLRVWLEYVVFHPQHHYGIQYCTLFKNPTNVNICSSSSVNG